MSVGILPAGVVPMAGAGADDGLLPREVALVLVLTATMLSFVSLLDHVRRLSAVTHRLVDLATAVRPVASLGPLDMVLPALALGMLVVWQESRHPSDSLRVVHAVGFDNA